MKKAYEIREITANSQYLRAINKIRSKQYEGVTQTKICKGEFLLPEVAAKLARSGYDITCYRDVLENNCARENFNLVSWRESRKDRVGIVTINDDGTLYNLDVSEYSENTTLQITDVPSAYQMKKNAIDIQFSIAMAQIANSCTKQTEAEIFIGAPLILDVAILIAENGFDVNIFDQKSHPIDKKSYSSNVVIWEGAEKDKKGIIEYYIQDNDSPRFYIQYDELSKRYKEYSFFRETPSDNDYFIIYDEDEKSDDDIIEPADD